VLIPKLPAACLNAAGPPVSILDNKLSKRFISRALLIASRPDFSRATKSLACAFETSSVKVSGLPPAVAVAETWVLPAAFSSFW
jgi:hypothetical protein